MHENCQSQLPYDVSTEIQGRAAVSRVQLGDRCLIGSSPQMQLVYDAIARLANWDITVLIIGETGTGKELVARAIHQFSARSSGPFVVVDCGAIPSSLIESELFGYVRGAFTGAAANKQGLLEAAAHGTVFLDEICDLPLTLQSRLLRALQEHEIRPLGTTRAVRLDARIICATNCELEQCLREGRLRRDLYFRLSGAAIRLPLLRQRKYDIPLLAEHFLQSWRDVSGKDFQLSDAAMSCLLAYDWPGNIRCLEKCIEAAVALAPHRILGVVDLPERIRKPTEAVEIAESLGELSLSLEETKKRAIARALEKSKGNKMLAARLLGIGKTTLYRRLKEREERPGRGGQQLSTRCGMAS